jgi:hypothetical protein
MEGHDGAAAASDTNSVGILGVVDRTSAAADIDVDAAAVDAAEALAEQVDAVQHVAWAWKDAGWMNPCDSCTEAAGEASARSPRLVRLTWHETAVAH